MTGNHPVIASEAKQSREKHPKETARVDCHENLRFSRNDRSMDCHGSYEPRNDIKLVVSRKAKYIYPRNDVKLVVSRKAKYIYPRNDKKSHRHCERSEAIQWKDNNKKVSKLSSWKSFLRFQNDNRFFNWLIYTTMTCFFYFAEQKKAALFGG